MVMNVCSAFPKAPGSLESYHKNCLVSYIQDSNGGGSYPTAEEQSVYSTATADRAMGFLEMVSE